jgi:signal peptidase II
MAKGLVGIQSIGPMGLVLHHNPGAFLGSFSNLPATLRIVTLSTGGAFLIFTFVAIQLLMPLRIVLFRVGLTMLLGGILGNVLDRILYGYVIDFLVLGKPKLNSPVFNVADVLQLVGYGLAAISLIKERKILWPEINSRKTLLVNKKFQLQYSLKLTAFGFCFALIAGTLSYTYLKVTIVELVGPYTRVENQFLIPFIITFLIISSMFTGILFYTGLLISHRAAGPLYAFERFLEDLFSGKSRKLKLRTGDEFQHLQKLADELYVKMESNTDPPPLEEKKSS